MATICLYKQMYEKYIHKQFLASVHISHFLEKVMVDLK